MAIICPNCQGSQVQKLSSVYRQNTTTSTTAIKLGKRQVMASSIDKTLLGSALAPPKPRSYGIAGTFLVVGLVLIALSLNSPPALAFSFAVSAFPAFLVYRTFMWNLKTFPELEERWNRQWYCLQCEHKFQ